MKDPGLLVPGWALLARVAAPPMLTRDEPTLETLSRTGSHNSSDARSDARSEPHPDPLLDLYPEVHPDVRPDVRPESRSEPHSDSLLGLHSDLHELHADPILGVHPDVRPDIRSESRSDPHSDPHSYPHSNPHSDFHSNLHSEPRSNPISDLRSDPLLDFRPDSFSDVHPDPPGYYDLDPRSNPQLARPTGEMCSPEGQWNCMTNSWQRCASGMWSAVIPCAAGTICQPFGLTDFITIEHDPSAITGFGDNGHASDGGRDKSGKKSVGIRNSPGLVLLAGAVVTGVSWSFLV
ncbi:hypothetical protein J3E68DRAFT_397730 [Trichoderma sp. SZMC 28012]